MHSNPTTVIRLWIGVALAIATALGVLLAAAPAQSPVSVVGSPSSRPAKTHVGAAARATSKAAPYSFLMRDDFGKPARWNPCEPITWDWADGDPKLRVLARTAFRRVTDAAGLTFVERSSNGQIRVFFDSLDSGILGYGSFYADPLHTVNGRAKDYIARSGTLRIARRAKELDGSRMLNLLMHEIAHIVGLGHVKARSQVMYKEVQDRTEWGAGDRAGLTRIGIRAGCLTK